MSLFSNKKSDTVALCTESGEWTYGRLQESAEEIAAAIGSRSLLFLLCTNTAASITGYVACMNHGIVPAMIDGTLDGNLLHHLIEAYRPFYIWLPQKRRKEIRGGKELYSLEDYVLLETGEGEPYPLHEDLALLMTTSGSTGSPKFVRLSYENVLANTTSIIEYLGMDETDRSITNLPMHYVYGLSIINTHLFVGASLAVTEKTLFDKTFWQFFREKRVTNFGGVPYTYAMLNRLRFFQMDLPDLRTMTQAGGKLDPELHRKFAEYAETKGKRFFVMYGAAEATARMGYLPPKESLSRCGSMGVAIPGGDFELADENGRVIKTADTVGELIYHGPNVMMGYAVSGADLSKGDELHGTLHTGDLAKQDEEGFYTIVGRKKRFLKIFGKRTNLEEVEHLIRQHLNVTDVACGGVDDCLWIFLTNDLLKDKTVSYLSKTLGIHPTAAKVKILNTIPKNSSGKTLYRELERYYDL